MKKKRYLILVIAIVLVATGVVAYRAIASSQAAATSDLQTATVQRGSLDSTLGSSGNTRTGQSATISWQTSGQVGGVTLKPGDSVAKDQELAALDPTTLSADSLKAKQDLIDAKQALEDLLDSKLQQAQAQQAVEDAQNTLDSLKQTAAENASQSQLTLAQAQETLADAIKTRNAMNYPHSSDKLTLEKAETDYLLAKQAYKDAQKEYNKWAKKNLTVPERVQALNKLVSAKQDMDKKFATYNWYQMNYTANEIAQADAEVAVAQANLDKAQTDWDRLKDGSTSGEIAVAEAKLADAQRAWERVKNGPSQDDIDAAQAAVDAAQATLDHIRLLAPFAGTITEVDVSTGDLVNAGEAAFRVDDLKNLYVDLQISEVDLANLKVGQQATLEFDAIPDKTYTGVVTEIGMVGTVSNGVVNYPATVRITNPDDSIRPGMTASVTIVLQQVKDALLVPNKAIHTSNGQKTVTVLFEGQEISVPVTVGLVGDSMSQVTSDQLREGDTVVISGSSSTSSSSSSSGNRNNLQIREFGGQFGNPPPGLP